MLVLQPIPIRASSRMDIASNASSRSSSPPPFYHRTPAPSPEELRFFGLQAGNEAQSAGLRCIICRGDFQDPVITKCNHTFCFGCIYQWFGQSTSCPGCARDLYQARKLRKQPSRDIHPADRSPADRFSSAQWVRAAASVKTHAKQHSSPIEDKMRIEDKVLVEKTRKPGLLQIPHKAPRQPNHPDRSASAAIQHRNISSTSNVEIKRKRGSRHSLPSYGITTYIQIDSKPNHQASPSPNYHGKNQQQVTVRVVEPEEEPGTLQENMDPNMLELFDVCSSYLDLEKQASEQNGHLLHVDAERILSDMSTVSSCAAQDIYLSIRCKAIAKCVWREWREYLRGQDGLLVLAESLRWGLQQSFERTVVEYGWVQDWRELPNAFVDLMERTMATATRA